MLFRSAVSLAETNNYIIFIIGYPSSHQRFESDSIRFLPLNPFNRLSIQRLLAPLKILKKTIQVQPELLVVNTHELLIVGIINRILFGTND